MTYLEQNFEKGDKDTDIGLRVVQAWRNRQIRIGRKTMRGLGAVKDMTVCRRSFDLTDEVELKQWVDFDMYLDQNWEGTELENIGEPEENTGKAILLEWTLKQKGGISIRRYTTNVSKEKTQPDTDLQFRQALAASLADLHMGLVCVGGLTAVGRGIFEGESLKIDQEPVNTGNGLYEGILKRLERG